MEWSRKINSLKDNLLLDFENKESSIKSYGIILNEIKQSRKKTKLNRNIAFYIFALSGLIIFPILFLLFNSVVSNLILGFALTYHIFHSPRKIINQSPSLSKYLESELDKLGYEWKGGLKYRLFIILFGIPSFLFIFIVENIITIMEYPLESFFIFVFLYSLVFIPLFYGMIRSNYKNNLITLKGDYKLYIEFFGIIRDQKELDHEELERKNLTDPGLWVTINSNTLFTKNDLIGQRNFGRIAEKRGVLRYKRRFRIHSTPLNFQKQFLNIASAIREWDIYYTSEKLRSKKRLDKALKFIDLNIQRDSGDINLFIIKSEILNDCIEDSEEIKKAIYVKNLRETIGNGLNLDPHNFELLTFKGVFGKEKPKAFYKTYFDIISKKKDLFKKFKEISPYKKLIREDIDIYFDTLIEDKKFEEILEKIDKALNLDPENINLYINKSYVLASELSRFEEALKVIEQGLSVDDKNTLLHVYKMKVLLEFDKLDEAYKIIKKAYEINKKDDLILSEMSYLLLMREEYNNALQYIEEAIRINSEDMNYYGLKAQILLELGKKSQALEVINKSIENEPKNPFLNFIKAKISLLLDEFEDALKFIDITIGYWPENDENYYYKALILNDMGKFEEALDTINQGIKFTPNDGFFLTLKAQILDSLTNFQSALETINLAINISPKNSLAHGVKADILANFEDFDPALKEIDKAISLDADFSQHYNIKAQILKDLKRYDEALIEIDKAISLDPHVPELLANKALILGQFDKFEECLDLINKAIEINPEKVGFYREKALLLYELKDYQTSLLIIKEAISKDPLEPEYLFIKAQILEALEKYEEQLKTLNDILKINPDYYNAQNNKALVLTKLKRNEEAHEIIHNLNRSQPLNSIYSDTFGRVLMKMRNYKEAIEKFKNTIELESEADFIHETYIGIGKCYFKIGDFENAMENLMKGKIIAGERKKKKWIQKAEKIISAIKRNF